MRPRRRPPSRRQTKKGYWIIHILSIKNQEKFFAHLTLANSKTKYGGKTRIFAPVKATLKGDPVAFCAVIEFPSVQAAIDCWDDEADYGAAITGRPRDGRRGPARLRDRGRPSPELKPARASGSTTSTP